MYGSSLRCVTRRPRASSSAPSDALARPFPIDDTTPPVTKTNLVGLRLIAPAISITRQETQGSAAQSRTGFAFHFCMTMTGAQTVRVRVGTWRRGEPAPGRGRPSLRAGASRLRRGRFAVVVWTRTLRPQWLPSRPDAPGLVLALVIGVVSVGLAHALPPSPFVSDVMLALLIGALVVNTPLARMLGLGAVGKEREPDRYAAGLRFIGKWVLRLAIILMGMKVQTSFFGRGELTMIFGVAACSLPSAFFVAHVLGVLLGVRRPLVDLLAGGTMICGASAVNAIAPVVGAHRDEQGVAIAVMFLFSVVAMLSLPRDRGARRARPRARRPLERPRRQRPVERHRRRHADGRRRRHRRRDGGGVEVGAHPPARAGARDARARAPQAPPTATARAQEGSPRKESLGARIVESLPGFLLGYVGLAVVRALGDRHGRRARRVDHGLLAADKLAVDLLMAMVSAGIGLHLSLRTILGSSARAVAVGGGASVWTALVTLAMITAASRGAPAVAAGIGIGAGRRERSLVHRAATRGDARHGARAPAVRRAASSSRSPRRRRSSTPSSAKVRSTTRSCAACSTS